MAFRKPNPRFWGQLGFWLLVTLVFLYDRRYLVQKIGLPNFAACIAVRIGLLMSLAYLHTGLLWPRLWKARRYVAYGAALTGSIGAYLALQGLYDTFLFGFVIGDMGRRGVFPNLPYNFIATVWYLVVTLLLHLVLNRSHTPVELPSEAVLPKIDEPETIWLKSGTRRFRVAVSDILYVQGMKDYFLVFTRQDRHVAQGSLKVTESLLPAGRFVRVHKSFLVPVGSLRRFNRGEIELENAPAGQRRIPVGRSYRKDVEKFSQL